MTIGNLGNDRSLLLMGLAGEVAAAIDMVRAADTPEKAPKGPTPLFNGYIFVHCFPDLHLNAVNYCPGVLHIVRFDREPATVDQSVIDALRSREADRGYVVPTELELGIEDGRKVRVMAGPLEGMEGVFRGYLRGGQRARVLMEFLRRRSLVEVETELLAAVRA